MDETTKKNTLISQKDWEIINNEIKKNLEVLEDSLSYTSHQVQSTELNFPKRSLD